MPFKTLIFAAIFWAALTSVPVTAATERFGVRDLPVHAPSAAPLPGSESLPEGHRLALSRVNEYRKAMGLPLWTYDPALSKMAEAHVNYVLVNGAAGRPTRGHFENPDFPAYTKEGDEAARTSGLSSVGNALRGLESLVAGVFHRKQFIDPRPMRIGVGCGKDPKSGVASCLFVTRPQGGEKSSAPPPRFSIFPPENSVDIPLTFESEWPDPRPASEIPANGYLPTGYVISVFLNNQDTASYTGTEAGFFEEGGSPLPFWLSDPANPSHKTPPPGIEKVYFDYDLKSGKNPFSKNFNAVILMPKKPLEPGKRYAVRLVLKIGGSDHVLEWKFTTQKNQAYVLKPGALERGDFDFANLVPGDGVIFAEGRHVFPSTWFSKSLSLKGRGVGRTVLALEPTRGGAQYGLNFQPGDYFLGDLSLMCEKVKAIYLMTNTSLALQSVAVLNAPLGVLLASPGSKMTATSCVFSNIGIKGTNAFYVSEAKHGLPNARLDLGQSNQFYELRESMFFGGVGPTGVPGRVWEAGPLSMTISDALRIAADGEVVRLFEGEHFIEETWWLSRDLSLVGAGPERTKVTHRLPQNGYAFCLHKTSKVVFRDLALGGNGNDFYTIDSSFLSLLNVKLLASGGSYAVNADGSSRILLLRMDLSDWKSDFLLYVKGESRWRFSEPSKPLTRKIFAVQNGKSVNLLSDAE